MRSYNLLLVINDAPNVGSKYRFYIDGRRVTRQHYDMLCHNSTRQDSFMTKIKGYVTRHYKTVYIA